MSEEKKIENCPVCDESTSSIETFISCKDFTVSNKSFDIVKCHSCGFKFTSPIPVEEEIGEYYKAESYISHSSTNKGIVNRVYHLVRNYTLKKKRKLVESYLKNDRHLLDIGCGTGHFLNECKLNGITVQGLEPDDDARNFGKENFNLPVDKLENLYTLGKESFQVITMWHVLEHVYHLNKDLKQIHSLLKPGGCLIVAVPNCSSFDAQHYKENWAAYDVPRHLYHFTPKDMGQLAKKFNMELEEILPMKFDSYYVSMLSEKYKKGNLISAMWNGFKSNLKARNNQFSSQIYVLRKP